MTAGLLRLHRCPAWRTRARRPSPSAAVSVCGLLRLRPSPSVALTVPEPARPLLTSRAYRTGHRQLPLTPPRPLSSLLLGPLSSLLLGPLSALLLGPRSSLLLGPRSSLLLGPLSSLLLGPLSSLLLGPLSSLLLGPRSSLLLGPLSSLRVSPLSGHGRGPARLIGPKAESRCADIPVCVCVYVCV